MNRPTILDPQIRGDDFRYLFTLGNGWTASMFTGGLKFTLRTSEPDTSVVDDSGAIDQASVAGGEISFSDTTHGIVAIPAARVTTWPTGRLLWDLQGVVSLGAHVYTIDRGTIVVTADITRST